MSPDPDIPCRWTARRKAAFLDAVKAGDVGPKEIKRLGISLEELRGWQRDFATYGLHGLRATYRPRRRRRLALMVDSSTPLGRAHH
jgi:transposase